MCVASEQTSSYMMSQSEGVGMITSQKNCWKDIHWHFASNNVASQWDTGEKSMTALPEERFWVGDKF